MVNYNVNIKADTGAFHTLTVSNSGSHLLLMQSLVNLIKMAAQCTVSYNTYQDDIVTVCEFLHDILPDESQLNNGIETE